MEAYLIHIISKDLLQIQTGARVKILGKSKAKVMQKLHLLQKIEWDELVPTNNI